MQSCHSKMLLLDPACAKIRPCAFSAVSTRRHRPSSGSQAPRDTRSRGFLDELTDFINAGPKLRKWYGEGELIKDGQTEVKRMPEPEDIPEEQVIRDAVLVTDADSATGEQIVLQLILARLPVKVLTKDAEEAKRGYGPYVTAFTGDLGDAKVVKRALRGVRAVICPGKLGTVIQAAAQQGVEHIVLLSAGTNQAGGLSLPVLFGGEQAILRDPKREVAVQQSGIPFTVVRSGRIKDVPGSQSQLDISQVTQGSQDATDISREDIARVLVGALQVPPQHGVSFQVSASGPGRPPEDWVPLLNTLYSTTQAKTQLQQ